MSLSRLELVGFKSFMSPVTLHFKQGITAILGPNGCGKTNIVDAVRWVLGEQSARQLRSTKMENVIFNGTEMHKPLGYALVNMTIDNERGVFPLEYSEITITRKVYRSGISEYFINKTPCRLRDVKELFADTGTGSHSYAVIEQEMIDYVLNDAHGDRRLMFEEASGIVKYRMRRDEAKRKLKLTEGDVVRLEDILEELGAQVRSLRYQVGKARRYRTVQERIRQWGLIHLRSSLSELLGAKRTADSKLGQIANVSRNGDESLGGLEKIVEAEKLTLIEFENRNTELQNSRYEVRRNIQTADEKVIQFSERRKEALKRIERAETEIGEAKKRLETIDERIRNVTFESETISATISKEKEFTGQLTNEFKQVNEKIAEHKNQLLQIKQTHLDFLQDQVRVKSSQEHYESILGELDVRTAETRDRILELEHETAELNSDMSAREAGVRDFENRLEKAEQEREELISRAEDKEQHLGDSELKLSGRRTELARLKSKRELYQRMVEELEGFPSGARYLLTKGDPRVRGPLAELVKADKRFRPALEAVLGGMLDGVVVDKYPSAVEFLEELTSGGKGRVRLFMEDTVPSRPADSGPELDRCLGRLSEHVKVNDLHRPLVDSLLGETFVFEETGEALEAAASTGLDTVSLAGVSFSGKRGVSFAGSPEIEVSLLGRSDEVRRLSEKLAVLELEVSRLESDCETLRAERDDLRGRIKESGADIVHVRDELERLRAGLQEVERDHIMKKEQCSLLMKSLNEAENSRVSILSKLEEAKLALEMQQAAEETSETAKLEAELAELNVKRGEIEMALTDKKVAIASLEGKLEKKDEEIRGLREMEKQFSAVIEQRTAEIESSNEETVFLDADIEKERKHVTALLETERSYETQINALHGDMEEKRNAVREMEKELKAKQSEREQIISRENEIKITLSTIETRMKDLIDRGVEVFNEDLSCYLAGEELPLAEEESAVTEEMLEKEKRKLESLGAVNLAAVEEFEEKKQRYEFLTTQKEDLVTAKGELEEAIRKINKRARKRFLETFEIVRRNFTETFAVLFEGGEANLSLEEGSDPLEADIIINATPKGKRLQDISLLSGGERALTALALLFALYKAKPSPFCIFDEVDAPLDDANIQRFIRMLHTFQDDTQFIIITHNKRTMEIADTLYGVTMEQRGISSVVSVDMTGIERVLGEEEAPVEELVEVPISTN